MEKLTQNADYAIFLAVAKAPMSQLDFTEMVAAAKTLDSSVDEKKLKSVLPQMFDNALEQNTDLKLYVRCNNVANTRDIQSALLDGGEVSDDLWNDSVWSVMPFADMPANNMNGQSDLSHGDHHRNRGVKPFKSYKAKIDQARNNLDLSKRADQAKTQLADSTEKAKQQFDKTSDKVKEQGNALYKRLRGSSMRFRNRFFRK